PELALQLLHSRYELARIDGRLACRRLGRLRLGRLLWLRLFQIADRAKGGSDLRYTRIPAAGLDRLSALDRLELRIGCQLQVMEMRLAERPIFIGLRHERIEPALHVALLDSLLQTGSHIHLGMRDRVNLVELGWVGIAICQRGSIFESCIRKRGSFLAALQEQVRLKPVGRRLLNCIEELLFGVALPFKVEASGIW